MALKPGPKPIAKSTGKPDQRRRDNKTTPGNTPSLKPSKSSKPPQKEMKVPPIATVHGDDRFR